MPMKIIIENIGEIEYNETEHILYSKIKNSINIDEKIAKDIIDKTLELTGDDKFGTISDLRQMVFIDSAARKVMANYRTENLICVATVINNRLQSGFANLFVNYSKPSFEIKFFTDYEKAKEWVKSKVAEYYRLNL
jgi:hypothetical protein